MEHIIVVGNGKSSRVNVESLLDDYFFNKDNLTLVLPVFQAPSVGQVFAAQYAHDKEIPIMVVAPAEASFTGLPVASFTETNDPFGEDLATIDNAKVFILWDDNDVECSRALAWAKSKGYEAKDLTNGLLTITPADALTLSKPASIPDDEKIIEEEMDEEDNLEESDEDTVNDDLYAAIETIANIFADIIIQRIKDAQ